MRTVRRHVVALVLLALLSSILPSLIVWIALDNGDPDYIGIASSSDGHKYEYYRIGEILSLFAIPFTMCFIPLVMIYSVIRMLGRR